MKAKVVVDAKNPGPEIHPFLFGHFLENMGRSIYRGGLLDRSGSVRDEVVSALDEMHMSMVRWPGGLFADGYHWQDGIGSNRPVRPNRYWRKLGPWLGPKDPNYFGTHEFLGLCERLSCAPYVNVNLGTGSVKSAADWVEYCNGSAETTQGAKRASNGRKDPWNVKVWGLGNEIFGWWSFGHCNAETYGKKYLEFYDAMKAVDPTIETVAVGTCDGWPDWNRKLLSVIGDKADYLSFHVYLPALNNPKYLFMRVGPTAANHYALSAAYMELDRKIKYVAKNISDALGENPKMKIALDEWNLWWWWPQAYKVFWKMRDAVALAGMAGAMVDNCGTTIIGNLAQAINVLGLLNTDYDRVVKTPLYYVMQMCAEAFCGNRLDCSVESESIATKRLGGIPAQNQVPMVSVWGAADKKQVALFVVQRKYNESAEVEISVPGVTLQSMKILSAYSPEAKNTFENPDAVTVKEEPIKEGKDGAVVTLPASSVVVLFGIRK